MTNWNLKNIRKGDTYTFTLRIKDSSGTYQDISGWSFKLMGKTSTGTTVFTWSNTDFVSTNSTTRTLTLTPVTTATYSVGEVVYDMQVTYPDTTQETIFKGYVIVEDQVTS